MTRPPFPQPQAPAKVETAICKCPSGLCACSHHEPRAFGWCGCTEDKPCLSHGPEHGPCETCLEFFTVEGHPADEAHCRCGRPEHAPKEAK